VNPRRDQEDSFEFGFSDDDFDMINTEDLERLEEPESENTHPASIRSNQRHLDEVWLGIKRQYQHLSLDIKSITDSGNKIDLHNVENID